MRGFGGFEEFIRGAGGIISRRELLAAGWTADELRIAYGVYGRPTRLRRGWYCSSEVPLDVREAWAHGGPLACVSALRWYSGMPVQPADAALHVCLPRHAQSRRVESTTPRAVVRHWRDAGDHHANRWAVPLEIAREQALRCEDAWRSATRMLV